MIERTFVMTKPDAYQRGLIGEVISRLEKAGLRLIAAKFKRLTREEAQELYKVHKGKTFYEKLVNFVTSSPVMLMVWEGPEVVKIVRKLIGATSPDGSTPGSIRGDFSVFVTYNVVHASDSQESARREMSIFFTDEEIYSVKRDIEKWVTPEFSGNDEEE